MATAPARCSDLPFPDPPGGGSGKLKVIVFDDDPTGSQTVHGCPLLLRWDGPSLAAGLRHPSPLLFLLANSRALDASAARQRIRAICRSLAGALAEARRQGVLDHWLVVSRGDSTLRGHFPLEVEVINEELGPFDATFLAPAFLEGGRTTVDGVHLLHGQPVHRSPFARDSLFGYGTSHLPGWVEEKSGGRIPADQVGQIGLRELEQVERGDPQAPLLARLAALEGNPLLVVDASRAGHLAALGTVVRQLAGGAGSPAGRPCRFLFQSAASLLNGLVNLPPQPLDAASLAALRRRDPDGSFRPGLVVVGSHVPLADAQLAALLAEAGCRGVEVPVARVQRVLEGPLPDRLLASLEEEWLEQLRQGLAAGLTPVLHTSRGELACRHAAERRRLGQALAEAMARVVARLAPELGYVISKGGITSHTLLAEGLGMGAVELQGQIAPGLSLVLTPEGPGVPVPGLAVVTFPGNLGDAEGLVQAWRLMEGEETG
jgi:uncharacterized protein YgbK (DUF1537 family)